MPITVEPTPEDLPAGAIRVHEHYVIGDQPASLGYWLAVESGDAPTSSQCADLAESLHALFGSPTIQGNLSTSCILERTQVVWNDGAGGAIEGSFSGADPGLQSGDAMPANTCAVLSTHDGSHYRGGKGRMYWPGQANAAAESTRQWSDDFVNTMDANLADLLAAVNALTPTPWGSVLWVVWHRWSGGVAITPTASPVTSITVQPRICTQRRRLGPTI